MENTTSAYCCLLLDLQTVSLYPQRLMLTAARVLRVELRLQNRCLRILFGRWLPLLVLYTGYDATSSYAFQVLVSIVVYKITPTAARILRVQYAEGVMQTKGQASLKPIGGIYTTRPEGRLLPSNTGYQLRWCLCSYF